MAATPAVPVTTLVEIQGDLVEIVERKVVRAVRTNDLMAEMGKNQPVQTGILPANCFAYTRHNRKEILLVQQPPALTKLIYKDAGSGDPQTDQNLHELQVSLPWIQWFITMDASTGVVSGLHPAVTLHSLYEDEQQLLYRLPLPNIYSEQSGAMCMGNLSVDLGLSRSSKIKTLLAKIFGSTWNHDLEPIWSDYPGLEEKNGKAGLMRWHDESSSDGEYWKKIVYKRHRHSSVAAMLNALAGGGEF